MPILLQRYEIMYHLHQLQYKNDALKKNGLAEIPRILTITKTTVVCVKHFEDYDII